MRRPILIVSFCALLLVVGALPLAAAEGSNTPVPAAEEEFFSRINDERTSRGLKALSSHTQATSVARAHSGRMADDGRIYHNGNLGSQMTNWAALGENVGVGPSVSAIHGAFMGSSTHRSNILGDFTHIGIGVVERDGSLYVTEVFVTPSNAGGSGGSGGSGTSGGGSPSSGGSKKKTIRPSSTATQAPAPSPRPRPARVRAAQAAPIQPIAGVDPLIAERTVAALERFADDDVRASVSPCRLRQAWC